ncbi:hypothetical protein HOLleu_25948 [Holothuria leucospilota]|uniref:Uncharacterized protein n=1 Tax=Holothuria leucospilota TaxID=206669 RepID=A0A9Q1H4C7_HOLLE|nr:hypothetical protein HOLleu_25948 [Holothuria leucospilota]
MGHRKCLPFSNPKGVDQLPDAVESEDFVQLHDMEPIEGPSSKRIQELEENLITIKQEKDNLHKECTKLQSECDKFRQQVEELKKQLQGQSLSYKLIQDDDKKYRFFTGLPLTVYLKTFDHLKRYVPHATTKDSLSYEDQFFLTLIRLRFDLSFELLAYQTGSGRVSDVNFVRQSDFIRYYISLVIKFLLIEDFSCMMTLQHFTLTTKRCGTIEIFSGFADTLGGVRRFRRENPDKEDVPESFKARFLEVLREISATPEEVQVTLSSRPMAFLRNQRNVCTKVFQKCVGIWWWG